MPRSVSKSYLKLKDDLLAAKPDNLGLQLGDLSHKAGVPPAALARTLHVAFTSVYRWTRGGEPRAVYKPAIRKVLMVLQYGLDNGHLPPGKGLTVEEAMARAAAEYKASRRS